MYVHGVEVVWLLESDGTIDRDATDPADWVEQNLIILAEADVCLPIQPLPRRFRISVSYSGK